MNRYLQYIWLAVVIALISIFIALIPNARINSNLFDLLPSQNESQYSHELVDEFTKTLDQQVIWLISSNNDIESSAQYWVDLLEKTNGFDKIIGKKTPEMLSEWAQSTLKFASLLSKSTQEKMLNGEYPSWVLSQIYSPFSGVSVAELNHDPMLLTRFAVLEQIAKNGQFSMQNGWITIKDNDRQWIMIRGIVDPNLQGMIDKTKLIEALEENQNALITFDSSAEILKKGSIFYADFAIKTAEKDITTIGVISMLGVVLIFFWIFRSWKAIGVVFLALSIGLLCGTVTVLLIYGEIHIITIVMSLSIIGIAIDYTLLFLTARLIEGQRFSPVETLDQVKMPLLGALISTLLAYCVLLFAPFAGLTQLAIFTMSGLVGVFFTVVFWFPVIANIKVRKLEKLLSMSDKILNFLNNSIIYQKIIPILILVVALVGISQIFRNDDISHLQKLPPQLLMEDQQIGSLLKQASSTQVLMITGKTANQALENLENIYPLLDSWVENNVIDSYQSYPFQSIERQKNNSQLLQQVAEELQSSYEQQGISTKIDIHNAQVVDAKEWLTSPISEGWELLWQTLPNGESAIIVSVGKILDLPILMGEIENQPNLFWVDRKTEISHLFSTYRNMMEWLIVIAIGMIISLFIAFKGIKQGFRMSIPIVLSVLFPLGVIGIFGIALNLFNVLALVLVIGMSIDYVLFFSSDNQKSKSVSLITIVIAALVAELTFGLLAMSGTNAIAGFGLILLLGILTSLFLSPLAISKKTL